MYCLFCVVLWIVCVCVCVLFLCHRVATQLQLNIYRIVWIISYHIYIYIYTRVYHVYHIISYHISCIVSIHYLIKFSKIPNSSTSFLQLKHYNSYMFRLFSGHLQEADIGICICTCRCGSSLTSLTHTARRTGIWYPVEARLFIGRLWLADLPIQWHVTVMHGGTQCNKLSG
jgi:hypothetical protein